MELKKRFAQLRRALFNALLFRAGLLSSHSTPFFD
jgi:hypothetical protein